jgi:integrase/recombinase XerC
MQKTAPARGSSERNAAANAALVAQFAESLAGRPAHTKGAYVHDVEALAAVAGDALLRDLPAREVRRALAALHARGLSGRSLARMLSAWRAFYRFLQDRGGGENPCAGLRPPKAARRLPSALSPDEAAKLLDIDGSDPLALRDRALFELAYSSGLRLAELARLGVDGVDLVRGEVRVWGKGAKERIVPVGRAAREAIRAWIAARASIPDADPNALFVGTSGRRVAPRTIERRLAARAAKQGLAQHVHPHMLRHSMASHVLQSSGDLRAVQEMLGHASIASTQVYTHLDFQHLAKAYDAAHPRAKRRRR